MVNSLRSSHRRSSFRADRVAWFVVWLTALVCSTALSLTAARPKARRLHLLWHPEVYKVVAENMDFRVLNAILQPGQEDKFHSHPADQVSLCQTDCKLRLTSLDGSGIDISQKRGEAAVRMGKPIAAHMVKNIGDKACVIWIVESQN